MLIYYTYVLIDPRNCQPFYVGKGTKRRMYDHWKHRHAKRVSNWQLKRVLCELEQLGLRPTYVKVVDNVCEQEAFSKEVELIHEYGRLDMGTGTLCNMTCGGDGVGSRSKEWRKRKSQTETEKNKGRPVSQYTLLGEYVSTFPSAKRASEYVVGANRSYITQCCKKKRKTAGGFMWIYEDDEDPTYSHKYHKPVNQYTLDGIFVRSYNSLTEAAKTANTTARYLSKVCSGDVKSYAGYVWKRQEDL